MPNRKIGLLIVVYVVIVGLLTALLRAMR